MTTRAPALAHRVVDEHRVDRGVGFGARLRDDHALARREPVGLDHDRRAALGDVGVRRARVGERAVRRGRHAVALHERLGEVLRAFELRRGARRAEDRRGPLRETRRRCRRPAAPRGRRRSARSRICCAKATSSAMSVIATLTSASSRAVPALPGATYTRATRGLCAIFHASACSLPPPPMTRMFMARSDFRAGRASVRGSGECAGEHHREPALVGRRDHFRVAHAAARLDHRRGAVVGDDVEAVAEREERVGRHRRAARARGPRSPP